jgi:methyl-accepting chemotaxis protein
MREIQSVMAEVDRVGVAIAAAMVQQRATTAEIAKASAQAAAGSTEAHQEVMSLAPAARDADKTSENATRVATDLTTSVDTLRQSVDTFLERVAAA